MTDIEKILVGLCISQAVIIIALESYMIFKNVI